VALNNFFLNFLNACHPCFIFKIGFDLIMFNQNAKNRSFFFDNLLHSNARHKKKIYFVIGLLSFHQDLKEHFTHFNINLY